MYDFILSLIQIISSSKECPDIYKCSSIQSSLIFYHNFTCIFFCIKKRKRICVKKKTHTVGYLDIYRLNIGTYRWASICTPAANIRIQPGWGARDVKVQKTGRATRMCVEVSLMGMMAGVDVEIKVIQKRQWGMLITRRWSPCRSRVGNSNAMCLTRWAHKGG